MKWNLAHKSAPAAGELVSAIIMNENTGLQEVLLRRVDEDDCDWRVADPAGGYEAALDYQWEVVGWRIPDPAELEPGGLIPHAVISTRGTAWEPAIAAGLTTWIRTPFSAIGGRAHLIAIFNAMRKLAPRGRGKS